MIAAELNRYKVVGQSDAKKAGRHRAAQSLASPTRAGGYPRGDLSEQHHSLSGLPGVGKTEIALAAGQAGRRAVHQGRSVEVHRGRLASAAMSRAWCATSSRAPWIWCALSARPRSRTWRMSASMSGCSICCCRRPTAGQAGTESAMPPPPGGPRREACADDGRRRPRACTPGVFLVSPTGAVTQERRDENGRSRPTERYKRTREKLRLQAAARRQARGPRSRGRGAAELADVRHDGLAGGARRDGEHHRHGSRR